MIHGFLDMHSIDLQKAHPSNYSPKHSNCFAQASLPREISSTTKASHVNEINPRVVQRQVLWLSLAARFFDLVARNKVRRGRGLLHRRREQAPIRRLVATAVVSFRAMFRVGKETQQERWRERCRCYRLSFRNTTVVHVCHPTSEVFSSS